MAASVDDLSNYFETSRDFPIENIVSSFTFSIET